MIMRPGQPLLLPASPLFIWGSLVVALLGNLLLNMGLLGRAAWMPDLLALTLVFWNVHQPQRVSVGAAFVFGLAMDVHHTALLGQHALAYTVLGFMAVSIHRRLLWFPVLTQTLHVLPLFAVAQVLVAPGDVVQAGQPLASVEAMKMETWVHAGADGRVLAVHAQPGAAVAAGTLLVELELLPP